jgi:NADH:ubiquinone oxidoreductase subunit 4 (subunit M)
LGLLAMVTLLIALPLLAFCMISGGSFGTARSIALWMSMLVAVMLLSFWWFVDAAGFALGVRGGSWLMLLGGMLTPLCVLSVNDTRALASVLLLEACVFACVLTMDCLAFYIFFEACSVPMLLLITRGSVWHRFGGQFDAVRSPLRHKVSAAYRLLTYTMVGSLVMLPLLLLNLHHRSTSCLASLWGHDLATPTAAGMLFFFAFGLFFGIKLPLVPLHLWLPEAHVAAPTAGSVLLSGVFLQLGGFGFLFISLPLCAIPHAYSAPGLAFWVGLTWLWGR